MRGGAQAEYKRGGAGIRERSRADVGVDHREIAGPSNPLVDLVERHAGCVYAQRNALTQALRGPHGAFRGGVRLMRPMTRVSQSPRLSRGVPREGRGSAIVGECPQATMLFGGGREISTAEEGCPSHSAHGGGRELKDGFEPAVSTFPMTPLPPIDK